jgi:DNA-binding XRE family transcriptional regulator
LILLAKIIIKMNQIKKVLKQQGRTQIWLAVQLDVTKSTMSSWCNHHSEPNLTYIYKASDILNVQLTELLADKADLKKSNK